MRLADALVSMSVCLSVGAKILLGVGTGIIDFGDIYNGDGSLFPGLP